MLIKDKNLYYVGGVVRDELLGVPSFDTDYCYEGNAIEFTKGLNVIKSNPAFGTVRVLIDNNEIDIASTRTESYPLAGHLPVVDLIGCSLEEDLKRRDFTINAIAKNTLTNQIIDFFDGRQDIKNKKIKILHDKSFVDDPTRIIRALKFSVRFGFELDEYTKFLQDEYLKNINYDMSFHRIKKELVETFNLNRIEAYNKFIGDGIYKLLGENQKPQNPIDSNVVYLVNKYEPKSVWLVYLGDFNLDKLPLNCEEQKIIDSYNKIKKILPQNDVEAYKLFVNEPIESILLYAVFKNLTIAENYLENLSKIKVQISGEDLLGLGIKSGKIFKEIFEYLLEQKISNPLLSKEEELEIVKTHFLISSQ